jgi:hypothetical protein
MKKLTGIIFFLILSFFSYSQRDSSKTLSKIVSNTTFSAYLDIYYAYDFSNPSSHVRPSFLYNHNRHNEVNLNLGYVKVAYASERIRANLALMAGTYAQYNLASEQGLLRNVFEANAGIKLCKNLNLWLDAGVFTSHIGLESPISKDCWTLTRSIVAENSPYYLSGAKVTYTTKDEKWLFSVMYLNGWQRIQRIPGNNSPNFSTQITWKPNNKLTLNYSTFIGNDKPDSARQMRYYNNVYAIWQATSKWGLTVGFDYGLEQRSKGSSDYNNWYTPTGIVRFSPTNKVAMAIRAEYYSDEHGVIIATGTPSGFKTSGYSINFDYKPEPFMVIRLEGRMFHSKDTIFNDRSANPTHNNYFLVTSFAVSI